MNWRTMVVLVVICGLCLSIAAPCAHEEAVPDPQSARSTVELTVVDVEVRIHLAHHPAPEVGPLEAIRRGAAVVRAVIRVVLALLDQWFESRSDVAEINPGS